MEFFFPDIESPGGRLPPAEVRFADITVEPYSDGRRVRVSLGITPFLERPYIELEIRDGDGQQLAAASVVEPMNWKLELTLHLRRPSETPVDGDFVLAARMFYPDMDADVDRREIPFAIALED